MNIQQVLLWLKCTSMASSAINSTPAHTSIRFCLKSFTSCTFVFAELCPRLCSQVDWCRNCSAQNSGMKNAWRLASLNSGAQHLFRLGFPTRFLPKPKNQVTRSFSKPKKRFLAACKHGFSVLNFDLQMSNYGTILTSVIFVTKIKTRTRIIGRRFQRTRTRIIVIQKTKTK